MFKRIDHVEITPADIERTMAFYRDILGFTEHSRFQMGEEGPLREIAYMTLGDTMIEFLGMRNPVTAPQDLSLVGYRAIALEVDDMAQTIKELEGKGVPITWGPMNIPGAIRAEIRDPDGLGIELREWVK